MIELGRIAPTEPQKEQLNGGGYVWRYKVRILSKHIEDKETIPDENLPWVPVLMPVTAGSGAANQAVFPMINQGDTVRIEYMDADEQQPIITGILNRTNDVSTGPASEQSGYVPQTGYSEEKPINGKIPVDETNQSNSKTQPTPIARETAPAIGNKITPADICDRDDYKTNAISTEIDNLFNQISKFQGDVEYVESLITGAVDRVHSIANQYVGEIFNNLFESLVPVLNAGLKALYAQVYAAVLASTGNPTAARLAAEAALIALIPAVNILQDAIQFVAAEIVNRLFDLVDDLIRDAVDNNDNFTQCAGEQFTGSFVNAILDEIDKGIQPLLDAISIITGGFNLLGVLRSGVGSISSLFGGLLSAAQGGNKCKGKVKEYAIGIGAVKDLGNNLSNILNAANEAAAIAQGIGDAASDLTKSVGSFPFLSGESPFVSNLDNCSTNPPDVCFSPEVVIFGGRGEGATAVANVGDYVRSIDDRTISDVVGGVVSIEVTNGGSGYKYPPFVEIRDNCGLGLGGVARAIIKNGSVVAIYIVTPGSGYPSDGRNLFAVGSVEVLDTGSNYTPGIVMDQYGGEYEVVITPGAPAGAITTITPINIVQVPDIPVINIPTINPPIPVGGRLVEDDEGLFVVDGNGQRRKATRGSGLRFRPRLIKLPNSDAILRGEIPLELQDRISQEEILEIISCVQS